MSERSVPLENLEIWHRAAAENRALRLWQITELAQQMPTDAEAELPLSDTPLPALAPELPSGPVYGAAMALDEQMTFCRAGLPQNAKMPCVGDLLPGPVSPRVARLAGAVFEDAFRRFLPLLGTARPAYCSSLSELLEEVSAGNADFALLPIEDAKGVRFLHFYEEFDRLELHITHVCDVCAENGTTVRFALLSRQYLPTKEAAGEQLLEYRLSGQDSGALTKLLMAAENAGLRLYRTDALPDPSFEDGYTYHVILSTDSAERAAWLHAYLTAALPRAVQVGAYIKLKEGT